MPYMQRRRTSVKSNPDQFDFFHLLEEPPTTVADQSEFFASSRLVQRVHRQTGWSIPRCRAAIEANGGPDYV